VEIKCSIAGLYKCRHLSSFSPSFSLSSFIFIFSIMSKKLLSALSSSLVMLFGKDLATPMVLKMLTFVIATVFILSVSSIIASSVPVILELLLPFPSAVDYPSSFSILTANFKKSLETSLRQALYFCSGAGSNEEFKAFRKSGTILANSLWPGLLW
jgi:hypothetical protein